MTAQTATTQTAQNTNTQAAEINAWHIEEKKRKVLDILEDEWNTCRRNYYMEGISGAEEAIRGQMARGMILAVERRDWTKADIDEIYSVLTAEWTKKQSPYLLAARKLLGDDVFEALQVACNAARCALFIAEEKGKEGGVNGKEYKKDLARIQKAHKALNNDRNY